MMNRTPVVSSNVASVGYDGSAQVLEVEFKDGSIYQYYSVPAHLYEGLLSAESVGQYLNAKIKKARFNFDKIAGR